MLTRQRRTNDFIWPREDKEKQVETGSKYAATHCQSRLNQMTEAAAGLVLLFNDLCAENPRAFDGELVIERRLSDRLRDQQ
jgi:hypothetical protein